MCLNYVFRHIIDSDHEKDKKSKKQEGGYVRTYLENLYKKK